jgi:hypothetical protein
MKEEILKRLICEKLEGKIKSLEKNENLGETCIEVLNSNMKKIKGI